MMTHNEVANKPFAPEMASHNICSSSEAGCRVLQYEVMSWQEYKLLKLLYLLQWS